MGRSAKTKTRQVAVGLIAEGGKATGQLSRVMKSSLSKPLSQAEKILKKSLQ